MNRNGHLIVPNRLEMQMMDGPMAMPITVNHNGQLAVIGGLTKLETVAMNVAGHLADWRKENADHMRADQIAARAVGIATAVLTECVRREVAPDTAPVPANGANS